MTRRSLVAASLVVCAALAAPAAVLAAWSAPQTVSAPHTFISPLHLGATGDGTLLAGWSFQDGIGSGAQSGDRAASLAPGATSFGAERSLPAGTVDVAPYGSTRVFALTQRPDPHNPTRLSRLRVQGGSVRDTPFGATTLLTIADVGFIPQLAVNARGDGIIAWIERTGAKRIVSVALRTPGKAWSGASTIIGTGRADAVATAVGPGGDRVVIAARDGDLVARVRPPGHGWGTLQHLGPVARGSENRLAAIVNARGRVAVVAVHRQLSEGGDTGPTYVDAWVQPAGRARFGARQRLDTGAVAAAAPALAITDDGTVQLAWVGPGPAAPGIAEGGATQARTASAPGSLFGAPRDLSPDGDAVKGLSLASAGDAGVVAAWVRIDTTSDGNGTVFATVRPPGADAFGPVGAVSGAENAQTTAVGATASAAGRPQPVVVWVSRPDGEGPSVPIAGIRTVVRAALLQP